MFTKASPQKDVRAGPARVTTTSPDPKGPSRGRAGTPGYSPRPRTGSKSGTQLLRARLPEAKLNTRQIVTRILTNHGRAVAENTPQGNHPRIPVPTTRTGRTRIPNLIEHSTESNDAKHF